MIVLIGSEEAFDKVQYPFMIKGEKKPSGMDESIFHLMKDMQLMSSLMVNY